MEKCPGRARSSLTVASCRTHWGYFGSETKCSNLWFLISNVCLNPKGGREVSDFISYLKREATNSLVMQEEPKKKKKKKKDDDKVEL